MPAIIGTIAQEGQSGGGGGSSAPTNVSIATSSSGNYDDAVVMNGEMTNFFDLDGSGFSSGGDVIQLQINQMVSAYSGGSPMEIFVFKGYCRATGATSFLWDVSLGSNTNVNNLSLGITGTASTAQDSTGTSGVGEKVQWQFAGGKSGTTYPSAGMELTIKVNCTATNAHGSTAADEIEITYVFN